MGNVFEVIKDSSELDDNIEVIDYSDPQEGMSEPNNCSTLLLPPHDVIMQGDPDAMRGKAKRCRQAGVDAIIDMADGLQHAATQIEQLKLHLNAMCGWAEILAEERDWTRQNANAFWTSYDAARAVAHD